MFTTSETILFLFVWGLTGAGLFFGIRARLRRRRQAKPDRPSAPPTR